MRTAIALSGLLALLLSNTAFADDKPVMVQAMDTFPSTLGYAALAAGGTIGSVLCAVIGKLWLSLGAKDVACQASIDAVKLEKQTEINRLRDRLELEQKDRREEAERLLREQKDIMREVMTLCASIPPALGQLTDTIKAIGGKP